MSNLIVQQYGKYKRQQLENDPFSCLLDTKIDINPHQIDAFCNAVRALKTGGIILADEVGLGKTIEAGLIIKYMIKSGAKKILISLPASLRKQWEIEQIEKFGFSEENVKILDKYAINYDPLGLLKKWLFDKDKLSIVLTTYAFSSKLMASYPSVKWDFIVIDEAHNMRNIFHGTKRAKKLYEISKNIPKILLTATPLQNKLNDLHGLVSFIDERIFGSEDAFESQYVRCKNYKLLKENLAPVLQRTLRKDVSKYMQFPNRECRTFDFELSQEEALLYIQVNNFLKKDILYCLPQQNRNLITLVIRKLLASSSFALIETFEILKARLEKLYEGTKPSDAQEGFDLFWQYLDDEIDEDEIGVDDDEQFFYKQQIKEEIEDVEKIIEQAEKIKENAKISALKKALTTAFDMQKEKGIAEKVVVFTESKRTQKYIAEELIAGGYKDDDILLFNGDMSDEKSRKIYQAYKVKNFGNANYGRAVEQKHAIVDYFKKNAKILILTDAGSEGLNLQFCNTVINYDLPWNPMKIEQRIGRCHRYGQKYDVVAINLLNTGNVADRRIYDILSNKLDLFHGVFGASDIALGILESGVNFEREILEIYQRCNTAIEINKEFDKLDKKLDAKRNSKARQLRDILLSRSSEEKCADLDAVKMQVDRYLLQVDYWQNVEDEDIGLDSINYWRTPSWGEKVLGSHGYLFVGALCNGAEVVFPVLLLCDEEGNYVDFEEDDLLPEIEKIDDEEILMKKYEEGEKEIINAIYDRLYNEMKQKYDQQMEPIKEYNRKKIDNWKCVQEDQLNLHLQEMLDDVREIEERAKLSTNVYEKIDLMKQAEIKRTNLKNYQEQFHKMVSEIHAEGDREIVEFDKKLEIDPVLLIKIVMRF